MGSMLTQLADSLLAHLSTGTYSWVPGTVTFERRLIAYFDRAELGDRTRVIVVPATSTQRLLARSDSTIRQQHEMTVDVVIQSPADYADNARTDPVAGLAEEVLARVATHKPWEGSDPCRGALYSAGYDPVIVAEDLVQYHIYTSRIVASYVVVP